MTDVTKTCRDINELSKTAQTAIKLFFQECYKAGVKIFVTETYRSQERQKYLYAQGRTRPGNIVSWTLNSPHKSRRAWDIAAATIDGNGNMYNTTIINRAGAIAMKLGITWGGSPAWIAYGAHDSPHFEIKETWTMPKGYSLEGKVSIPTTSNGRITMVKDLKNLPKVELSVGDGNNNTILDKGEKKLMFSGPTMEEMFKKRVNSKATSELLDKAAIKHLGMNSKLKNGRLSDGDLAAIATELAVLYAKVNK